MTFLASNWWQPWGYPGQQVAGEVEDVVPLASSVIFPLSWLRLRVARWLPSLWRPAHFLVPGRRPLTAVQATKNPARGGAAYGLREISYP